MPQAIIIKSIWEKLTVVLKYFLLPFHLDPVQVPELPKKFTCVFQRDKEYLYVWWCGETCFVKIVGIVFRQRICLRMFMYFKVFFSLSFLSLLSSLSLAFSLSLSLSLSVALSLSLSLSLSLYRFAIPVNEELFFPHSVRSRIVYYILRRNSYTDNKSNTYSFGL